MVLYCIRFFCTVSHCHVPLLQRAGELPRSASSHFNNVNGGDDDDHNSYHHLVRYIVLGEMWMFINQDTI